VVVRDDPQVLCLDMDRGNGSQRFCRYKNFRKTFLEHQNFHDLVKASQRQAENKACNAGQALRGKPNQKPRLRPDRLMAPNKTDHDNL
jgi:hypothetical protein